MRATIKDVAKAMDVNVGTVSRALNNKPGVSAKLRKRIVKKAAELGYRPNGHARGLVTQRTETIALVSGVETVDFLTNAFYAGVFVGIEAVTRENNYALMFASAARDPDMSEGQLPKCIVENRVDGILVVGAVQDEVLEHLQQSGYPFVLVDYHLPNSGMDTVVTSNREGGRKATAHLISLGHRKIGFVGGDPLTHGNFGERLQGYREALEANGITIRNELIYGGQLVGGYENVGKVLDVDHEVTAIVACNDANALAAMSALRDRGLRIPDDISVIGYDDIPASAEASPPLTTMKVDKEAMGRVAAQRLLAKLGDEKDSAPHETAFPAELVVRKSTSPPRS